MTLSEDRRNEIEAEAMTEFAKHPHLGVEAVVVNIFGKISVVREGPNASENWDLVQEVSNVVRWKYGLQ